MLNGVVVHDAWVLNTLAAEQLGGSSWAAAAQTRLAMLCRDAVYGLLAALQPPAAAVWAS